MVNLSHVNDPAAASRYPGDPPFRLTAVRTIAADGFHLQLVEQGEHTGTHWGAPAHFHADGLAADQLDPPTCSGPRYGSTSARRPPTTRTTG